MKWKDVVVYDAFTCMILIGMAHAGKIFQRFFRVFFPQQLKQKNETAKEEKEANNRQK